jgi:hypothetical protein
MSGWAAVLGGPAFSCTVGEKMPARMSAIVESLPLPPSGSPLRCPSTALRSAQDDGGGSPSTGGCRQPGAEDGAGSISISTQPR